MARANQVAASDPRINPSPVSSQEKAPIEPFAEYDPADDIPDSEYPGTLRLTAIMVSLMLSIFLVTSDLGYMIFIYRLTYACYRPLWTWYVQHADFSSSDFGALAPRHRVDVQSQIQ